jgi:hypothetical protein
MSFIQRELDLIRVSLSNGHSRYGELYAAQQALEWVLEPSGIRTPYRMITDTREDLEDCLVVSNPVLSGCAFSGQ